MTRFAILPRLVPHRNPGSRDTSSCGCRPRESVADRFRARQQAEAEPEDSRELQSKVYDPTATRFLEHLEPAIASQYWRRQRHLFGWPPARRRSRPGTVGVTTSKSA